MTIIFHVFSVFSQVFFIKISAFILATEMEAVLYVLRLY